MHARPVIPHRLKRIIPCAIVAACASSCASGSKTHSVLTCSPARPSITQIYEDRNRRFDNAAFFKPNRDTAQPFETTIAPLVVTEIPQEDGTSPRVLGTALPLQNDEFAVEWLQPTIYVANDRIEIGERSYDQLIYAWFMGNDSSTDVRLGGIRMTLASDGFPMIWEVLDSEGTCDLLFVSKSLENEAVERFGDPFDGRRFAIERPPSQVPKTVVVDVLPDGPMPMGPYVYISAGPTPDSTAAATIRRNGTHRIQPAPTITSVRCRCSPSQVEQFSTESDFDLVPLSALSAISAKLSSVMERLGLDGAARPASLTERLRLPPSLTVDR